MLLVNFSIKGLRKFIMIILSLRFMKIYDMFVKMMKLKKFLKITLNFMSYLLSFFLKVISCLSIENNIKWQYIMKRIINRIIKLFY